jgi:uncharacterized protein (DUF4415 family)
MEMSTSESFQRDRQRKPKKTSIPKHWVRVSIDPENPPPLTEEQRARIKALSARDPKEIDFSDIPESGPDDWKNAVRGAFYKPLKESITIRVDADVLAWLKARGPGYQTLINAKLREFMLNSIKKK